MDLLDALRTTGAVRDFTDEPVPDDVLFRVLDNARFAPSGGNRQGWRVVVLRDPEVRRAMRDVYLRGWYEYLAQRAAGVVPFAAVTDEEAERRAIEGAEALRGRGGDFAERLEAVPVLLVVLADLRALAAVDKRLPRYTFAGGASVYPFVWSLLLAGRAEGLAGVITTMPIAHEREASNVLGGLPDEFAVAALVALGHPVKQPRRLTRNPVEAFATVDRFAGPPFTGPTS